MIDNPYVLISLLMLLNVIIKGIYIDEIREVILLMTSLKSFYNIDYLKEFLLATDKAFNFFISSML